MNKQKINVRTGLWDMVWPEWDASLNLWFYPDYDTFVAKYPTWVEGNFVLLWDTDTFWAWDIDTSAWINTGIVPEWEGTVESITSMVNVWSITQWTVFPIWTTLTDFMKALLLATFNPTLNAPTFSLISNQANWQEIWSIVNLILTYNFNRWSIVWKTVLWTWNPSTFQDYRAWAATNYTIDWTDLDLVNTKTIASYELLNTQTFSGTVDFGVWPQPINSDWDNYSTPLAGGSETKSVTITAIHPIFYGKVSGWAKPTKNQALINSWTKVVSPSTWTITVNFNSDSDDWIWFAIPETSPAKTKWYVDILNNGAIGGASNLFDTEQVVSIDSPTGLWSWVNYRIYVSNYQSASTQNMQLQN